jgi:hypothetical protein
MFIVVESGSTKADWMVVSDGVKMAYNTKGFNPSASNSCYYDGITISEEVPALSYILGDEGSGCYLGKKLISGCINACLMLSHKIWRLSRVQRKLF